MEEIPASDINYNYIISKKLDNLFPKNIIYPNQTNINFNYAITDKNILINNVTKIDNSITNTIFSRIDKNIITECKLININKKVHVNTYSSKNKSKNCLYDMVVCYNNIIIVCGEQIIKLFYFNKLMFNENENTSSYLNCVFELYNKHEIFNTISYSNPIKFDLNIITKHYNENQFVYLDNNILKRFITKLKHESYTNTNIQSNEGFLFAAGGSACTIRVYAVLFNNNYNEQIDDSSMFVVFDWTLLFGHLNDVYTLKFHPIYNEILLSSSKDCSIRVWNALKRTQILIYGGPNVHNGDILSIDCHLSGDYIVSSSTDLYIKIWHFSDEIKQKIKNTFKKDYEFNISIKQELKQSQKVLIANNPIYSCNSIHQQFIDCVAFNGNFIVSKSVDGRIFEWCPIFDSTNDSYILINIYEFKLDLSIIFVKFTISDNMDSILIGNNKGNINYYKILQDYTIKEELTTNKSKLDISKIKVKSFKELGQIIKNFECNERKKQQNEFDNCINLSSDKKNFFKVDACTIFDVEDNSLIRKTYIDNKQQYLFCINDNGILTIFNLK